MTVKKSCLLFYFVDFLSFLRQFYRCFCSVYCDVVIVEKIYFHFSLKKSREDVACVK